MRDEIRLVADHDGQHAFNFRTLTDTLTPAAGGPPVVTHYPGKLEALAAWRRLTGTTTAQARRAPPGLTAATALAARRRPPQPHWRWNGHPALGNHDGR